MCYTTSLLQSIDITLGILGSHLGIAYTIVFGGEFQKFCTLRMRGQQDDTTVPVLMAVESGLILEWVMCLLAG